MLKKIQDKTETILRVYDETRFSDKKLYLKYLCIHHGLRYELGEEAYKKFEQIFLKADGFESVTRCRRKLQEKGLYVANSERKNREEEFIEYSRT